MTMRDEEIANLAVEENLNADGTAKYGTAQGYACALSAIRIARAALSSPDTPVPLREVERLREEVRKQVIAIHKQFGMYGYDIDRCDIATDKIVALLDTLEAKGVERRSKAIEDCPCCSSECVQSQKGDDKVHPYRVVCLDCGVSTAWHGDAQQSWKSWNRRPEPKSDSRPVGEAESIICGGCGATKSSQRCIGCLHDFGTPESAWVQKYGNAALTQPATSDDGERVREAAQAVVDNAQGSYRSRGKDRYIEDESGERMMLVPHEDWYRLQSSLTQQRGG